MVPRRAAFVPGKAAITEMVWFTQCPSALCLGAPGCLREKGHVFKLTSALADKTAVTVLLEPQGADFTAWELWTFLTATDVTAVLILPG